MSYKRFDSRWLMAGVTKEMRRRAMSCIFDYNISTEFLTRFDETCTGFHEPTGTIIKFTRDRGYHSSGWWKNPEYEFAFHLSLSFRDIETGEYAPRNKQLTKEWVELFYGNNKTLIWTEPPHSKEGKQADVWHYRLFVHEDWRTPLLPRKEVYSKDFTPSDWKSWSEVQADLDAAAAALEEVLHDP